MRITKINPRYEHWRSFIGSVPDIFEQEGKEIYNKRNLIKIDGEVDDLPEQAFMNVGTIEDAIAKGKKLIDEAKA